MKGDKLVLSIFFFIFVINYSYALSEFAYSPSNQSIIANQSLIQAQKDISLMQEKGIPTNRVNELYNDSYQLYEAQTSLEEKGKAANFDLIIKYCSDINSIKEDSLRANDELEVFIETYNSASKDYNMSSMQKEYDEIINSFKEERFEDTLKLIESGYNRISEIQSSQTNLKLFYETTSRSIKKWFNDNWKLLSATIIVLIVIYIIFYKSIQKIRINMELKRLVLRKGALNNLIKKLQRQYFQDNKISETEFRVKIERFKEMIRDVDRQIPLLNEKLAKLDYNNKPKVNPYSAENMLKKAKKGK